MGGISSRWFEKPTNSKHRGAGMVGWSLRSGIIKIDCDVLHTWISAAIVVTQSPYYAMTDQDGRFVIERLPAWKLGTKDWGPIINGFLLLRTRRALSRWSTASNRRCSDVILCIVFVNLLQ